MLALIGSNHRSAPLAFRERLAVAESRVPAMLSRLLQQEGIDEALVLSTCNRVEIAVRGTAAAPFAMQAVRTLLAEESGVAEAELDRYTYQLFDREAARHLFRVAAGLDSMILGEPQILGQVKQAYRLSKEHGASGVVLERLLQHVLAAAKRVRTETDISRHAVSVAFAAVELARRIFGDLKGRTTLLLGSGKMSVLLARHLLSHGVERITVASRTYNHAVAAAKPVGGHAVHWDDGLALLAEVDIVVSCTGSPHQILSKQDVAKAMRGRHGRRLFVIDIAVPRDVDAAVHELANVYLYDIDGLQNVVDSNLEERRQAGLAAEELIDAELATFARWWNSREIQPLIVSLRETLLDMGRHEITRLHGKLGDLAPQQESAVHEVVRGVIQKILHRPIRHLRNSVTRGEVEATRELFRELFGIADAPSAPDDRPAESPGPHDRPRLIRGGKKES